MAINKNHEFEDLNGVKCSIVERNATQERVDFLRNILEFNGYTMVVVPSPPPKIVTKPAAPAVSSVVDQSVITGKEQLPIIEILLLPPTFTIGVTDVTFNPVNAIFGRLLHAPKGHVVTLAYWEEKERQPHDEIPYYES